MNHASLSPTRTNRLLTLLALSCAAWAILLVAVQFGVRILAMAGGVS